MYQYFCVRLLNINYLFVTNSPPQVHFFFLAMKCELCGREMECLTVHHLVPRQAVKRKKAAAGPTANICSPCHHQIHTLFKNTEPAQSYNPLSALRFVTYMVAYKS